MRASPLGARSVQGGPSQDGPPQDGPPRDDSPADEAARTEAVLADLIARIARRDEAALRTLYDRTAPKLLGVVLRIQSDRGMAEDVLQDVFLAVWKDPAAFDTARGSVASWLLAMVHHKAVDAVRREESHRRRQTRAEDDLRMSEPIAHRDVEDEAADRVVSARVRNALQSLPAPQREALTLAYYGGYTQREVAALTGTPLGTVKTRMLAGMRRLKDTLGGAVGSLAVEGGAR